MPVRPRAPRRAPLAAVSPASPPRPPRSEPPATVVAVVAFERISPFHLCVPCVVFGEHGPGLPAFEVRVVAAESAPLRTTAGFTIDTAWDLGALQQADVVIVPSWRDASERAPEPLLQALRAAHARGAQLVGLCLGAFVLAQAGLLDARRATTHWAYAEALQRRFPAVQVDASVLYVEDGQVLTSAGTAAALDCCLHLLRRDHGMAVANAAARMLVVAPHRTGGQAQFIERPVQSAQPRGERLAQVLDQLRAQLGQPPALDALAAQLHMSRRTFSRQFRAATGLALGQWLQRERLALAQRLLEDGALGMEAVALQAGLGSAQNLRQQFRRALGVTPQQWRRSFCGA
ncbi:MAG: helix-turn-helix domain-containing protein [Rhodoferax sp.]